MFQAVQVRVQRSKGRVTGSNRAMEGESEEVYKATHIYFSRAICYAISQGAIPGPVP
jgi:hypothetical protein